MKRVSGILLSEEDGEYVAVTLGEANKRFNGMLRMNATAGFILARLEKETTEEELVQAILAEYDVEEGRARENVRAVLEKLHETGLIEE